MLVAGYEFPEDCPTECPFINDVRDFGQNAMCTSCPVFIVPDCVGPDEYRKDWAEEWHKFFSGGMQEWPKLYL